MRTFRLVFCALAALSLSVHAQPKGPVPPPPVEPPEEIVPPTQVPLTPPPEPPTEEAAPAAGETQAGDSSPAALPPDAPELAPYHDAATPLLGSPLRRSPPMRSAPSPASSTRDDVHWELLAYTSFGVVSPNRSLSVGTRFALDYKRFAFQLQYDNLRLANSQRSAADLISLLVGGLPINTAFAQLRLLAGVNMGLVTGPGSAGFAPVIGISTHIGRGIVGFDGSAALSFWPYWEFDARAALNLQFSFFKLQIGWRFVAFDPIFTDKFAGFLLSPNANGPYFALGFGW